MYRKQTLKPEKYLWILMNHFREANRQIPVSETSEGFMVQSLDCRKVPT